MGGTRLKLCLLSAVVVLHVLTIALIPNDENFTREGPMKWLRPYSQLIGFAAPFRFFAPDPINANVFFEWEMLDESANVIGRSKIPEYPDPYSLHDRYMRRLYVSYFSMNGDARAEWILLPWICKDPRVRQVRISRTMVPIPPRNQPESYRNRVNDRLSEHRHWISTSFCERAG